MSDAPSTLLPRRESKGSTPSTPFPSPLRPRTSRSKGNASAAPSMSPQHRGSEMSASPRCPRHRRAAKATGAKARSLVSPLPVSVSLSAAAASMGDRSSLPAPSTLLRPRRRQTGRDMPPRPLSQRPSWRRAAGGRPIPYPPPAVRRRLSVPRASDVE